MLCLSNPEKSKALKAAARPAVVLTITRASPVGVSIAIPNGDHFSGEQGIHDDASTTATSLISATTNMSTNTSTFDAGHDNYTNTPTNVEEKGDGGNKEEGVFDEEFDNGGDLMPDDWTFPGYIAFALLGPIVPPPVIPYRSELLMTVLPAQASGDGRASLRRAERENKRKANDVIESKITAPGVVVPEHQGITIPPNQQSSVSLQQKIMIARIAQSKMLIEQQQHFKMNNRVMSLYQKKVAAQRMMINKQKFTISITTIDDPGLNSQIQNLRVMNEGLKLAVAELIGAEEEIVAKDLAASSKNKVANNFIDLTIARVLGGNVKDKNDSGETPFQIDLSLEDEKMEKATSATPISSNKRSRMLCDTNITTPVASEASVTTSTSACGEITAQLAGYSIPTFCLANVEVSPLLDNTDGDDCHLSEENNEIS